MITKEHIERLAKLHANAAFRSAGPQFYEDEHTGKVRVAHVPVLDKDGKQIEEVFNDRNGKPVYKPQDKPGASLVRETRIKTRPDTGCVYCDIVDRTENPPERNGHCLRFSSYATGVGDTEHQALEDALNKAEAAVKPLTPAQRADIEAGRFIDPVAKSRIAELERELATLRVSNASATQVAKPKNVY